MDGITEEEFCHQQLTRLRADYERAAKQWIDRLVQIRMSKPPRYLVVRNPDGSLRIVGGT